MVIVVLWFVGLNLPLLLNGQEFTNALRSGQDFTRSTTDWQRVGEVAAGVKQSLASRQAVPLKGR